ncbi:MAG: carbohydrate ABC transporter permease [Phycisphaerales bacterium]|nr:carbohydrate ABC transporter permease [Phycisphaerales bacterium]
MRFLRKKRLNRSKWGDALTFLVLIVLGVFMALPFYIAIVNSLKPLEELFLYPPRLYVVRPTLDNFFNLGLVVQQLWVPFSRYLFNSVFASVVATVGHVVIASMAAFSLAKYKFPGSLLLFNVVVLSLLFAGEVTFIPRYIVLAKTGLINTYLALIVPWLAGSLGLFLMKQFMGQIPDELLESARMDGATVPRIYWSVAMPIVTPAWLTATVLAFQAIWNDPGSGYIFNEELKPITTALRQIAGAGIGRAGVVAAAGVLMFVPPVITFIAVQRKVLQTMAHSGIK